MRKLPPTALQAWEELTRTKVAECRVFDVVLTGKATEKVPEFARAVTGDGG